MTTSQNKKTTTTTTTNTEFFLSYIDWSNILRIKREKRLKNYDNKIILDLTRDNQIIISMIKELTNKNIFDLSRISYLSLLFLEPFITPYLKNLLEHDPDISYDNTSKTNETIFDYLPPIDNTISNILAAVIELLVFIELQLNIHLFLLHMHMLSSNTYCELPNKLANGKLSLILSKCNGIKPSTLLLLSFKILNKVGQLPNTFISKLGLSNLEELIPQLQTHSKKISNLLDNFIISINEVISSDMCADIWSVSNTHILNMAKTNLEVFGFFIDVLIRYLAIENPEQKDKLNCIKNSIINFLELEINLFEHKLQSTIY
jgi:hypothetical protein